MDQSIVPVNQLAVRSSTCYEFSNPNGAVVVEIEDDDTSVEAVEKQMEDLKLNHQFKEEDVPQIFQSLIKVKLNSLKKIRFHIYDQFCTMKFDETEIGLNRSENGLSIIYEHKKETIGCDDPEKTIVDHLWFVLRNPDLQLEELELLSYKETDDRRVLDSEKLTTLLQAMFSTIDHQIHANLLDCQGFNEETFLSMLKHAKPRTLGRICFDISWKNEGNYQKMKEIVETDQWKQAKTIFSPRVTSLKIDEFFHCEEFWLELASVTSDDVLRVVEHASKSLCSKNFILSCKHKKYDIDAITDFLLSQNDGLQITKIILHDPQFKFVYEIVKSDKRVLLAGKETYICIITE